MTKKEMAKEVAEKFGITLALATKIVQTVFDQIVQTLETTGRIELRDFGVFEVRKRRSRAARTRGRASRCWSRRSWQWPSNRVGRWKSGFGRRRKWLVEFSGC
jgi:nucleoid DNA-binding protein